MSYDGVICQAQLSCSANSPGEGCQKKACPLRQEHSAVPTPSRSCMADMQTKMLLVVPPKVMQVTLADKQNKSEVNMHLQTSKLTPNVDNLCHCMQRNASKLSELHGYKAASACGYTRFAALGCLQHAKQHYATQLRDPSNIQQRSPVGKVVAVDRCSNSWATPWLCPRTLQTIGRTGFAMLITL